LNRPIRRPATRTTLLAVGLAAAFAVAAPFASADRATPGGYDQLIVRFKDGTPEHGNAARRQQRLDAAGHAQGLHLGQLRRLAVGADVVRSDRKLGPAEIQALIAQLRADPRVAYAEVDARVYPAATPDDPQYANQWHYFEPTGGIDLPAAWDVTDGSGEVVAVIDTGVTAHTDLAANLVAGYDFIADLPTANDGDGRDADPSDPGDWFTVNECGGGRERASTWHGTHVAGTIAAVTNNATGVAGVAYGAKVQPVRVLGKCGGWSSDIDDAIIWASGGSVAGVADNPTPAKVINLSLGGSGSCLASTQAAIDVAVARGTTVVVAAGNDGGNAAYFQPASCSNIITVAATGRSGARAAYSNYGAMVDIAAPGGELSSSVLSTLNAGTTVPGAESYAGYQGTSMAAPHVAGVAALARAASGDTLTPDQIKTLLEVTARTLPVACGQGCGAGLLDAGAAVLAATTPVLLVTDPVALGEGDSGTHAMTFTVKLSQPVAQDVVFDVATADGSASSLDDYGALALPAQVIPAGSTSLDVVVTVNGDTQSEGDETFNLLVDNVSGPVTVVDDLGTARIADDDAGVLTANVPLTIADGSTGHFRYFTLDVPANAVNLSFHLSDGAGDADLWVRKGQAPTLSTYDCSSTYRNTQSETCWIMPPQGESVAGTWYVMVGAYSPYADVTLLGSYTLLPDISIGDASVTEGKFGDNKKLTFTVSLSQATTAPVYFDVRTSDGTANGSDYSPVWTTQGQLLVPAGQRSKTVTVPIMGDTTPEADETMTIALSNVMGAIVTDASATGTILDDDTPKLSIADAMVTEGDAGTKTLTFMVKLSQTSSVPVTYDIATSDYTAIAGEDYEAASFTGRTIPAGQLAQAFSVTLYGDTVLEDNEFFHVDVANASVPVVDGQAFGIIHNDEGPTLSINDFGYQEGNSGLKTMTFTVSLSKVSAVPVTFTIGTGGGTAVNGIDYTGFAPRTATIPAGSLSRQFLVTTQGDTAIEGNETFFVSLSNASVSITDSQGKGSIINDDGPTLAIGDAFAREIDGRMTFTISLSQAMAKPATFTVSTSNGTAMAGLDYQAVYPTELSIPAGQLSTTYQVMLYVDHFSEPPESFQLNLALGNVSIVDGVGAGSIRP
jgi:serine protease